MILPDSNIWIEHIRKSDPRLVAFLSQGQILTHPAVIGELMLGNLTKRKSILQDMLGLEPAVTAKDSEVIDFIEQHKLYGRGIGFVDVHLLVSAKLSEAILWTNDKRLFAAAETLGIAL